ncbi:ATP-dependent nuclease [Geosporobacter ferrireducens]|uniref:ATP-dependent endonuclease n=1 Tax=Geosporobacter ferrireducens TaxID=1424294 RepID=A0A1D8GKJ0_9FIRM|nr:AAA family ATPase [Geosporobacter ferrireducens]AOT71413.1 ATP-dependent endonuclease [Geosporobacter ferrireducens]MTI57717.1 ATP-dependent endonuclease [Geosporobacter ferrireducens]
MTIKKIKIENFKCFNGVFTLELNQGLNILVGNNEAGKSTILEAIHLALTGLFNGKYLKNELTQYLFNNQIVDKYLDGLEQEKDVIPPHILIEVFFCGEDLPVFEGNGNSEKARECGVSLKIAFDDKYQAEYEQLIKRGNIKTLPIEYYDIFWTSFARESITSRSIPIKSAMINSSSNRYQNGSDIYISRIVRDNLESEDIIDISQAHRKMRENFMSDTSIKAINEKIRQSAKITDKRVELSVELLSKNAWENSLVTYLDDVPFHYIGKGEQCIVKAELALSHKKSKEASVILIEEPENHLSHSKLNQLVHHIKEHYKDKQIIISTHSSFVANKLGLDNLILLNDSKTIRLNDLRSETKNFFEKISGYDTLRLILCQKAILVEGDSDELVLQKAYMLKNKGKLPIEDEIDVISVGTSFLRFLEIAKKINKPVVVVTDNDGNVEAVNKKYEDYLGNNEKSHIKICFDRTIDRGDLMLGTKPFNYNTLEPKILKINGLDKLNSILGTQYDKVDDLHKYMKENKTECALKIFDTEEELRLPEYILEAIR